MKSKRLVAWFTLVAFLAGCATPKSQAVPDFSSQAGKLGKIGVVIDAQVKYRSFGRDNKSAELSAKAVQDLQAAAVRELSAKGYVVTVLPSSDETTAFLTKYKELRGHINEPFGDARGHIAGVAPLPDAVRLASNVGVDGIAIVSAEDTASSPGVTLLIDAAVVALVVLMVVVAAHGGNPSIGGGGQSYNADFAIFDRKGKLVFYDRESVDLTNTARVAETSATFAGDLQGARK